MTCSYFERAIRMAFSARAMRFVTISPTMRKLAGALFQTVVPILTVLGFCECSTRATCHAAILSGAVVHRIRAQTQVQVLDEPQ